MVLGSGRGKGHTEVITAQWVAAHSFPRSTPLHARDLADDSRQSRALVVLVPGGFGQPLFDTWHAQYKHARVSMGKHQQNNANQRKCARTRSTPKASKHHFTGPVAVSVREEPTVHNVSDSD